MLIPYKTRNHKRCSRHKSLYDLGYFDFEQREEATKLLEPLGIGRNRPLIWPDNVAVLEVRLSGAVSADTIRNHAVLLVAQHRSFGDASGIFCGWKERDGDGREFYCLGIMDEQVTIAGVYYQCRKNPDRHRTLK